MTSKSKGNRVTVKNKSANPLFEKWLSEWRDQAKENNSKMQFTFSTALKTLKKYPLPLKSSKDCLILKGFGNTLCNMLDKKLKEYKTNNENSTQQNQPAVDIHLDIVQPTQSNRNKSPKEKEQIPKQQQNSSRTEKTYQPAKRSGGYAIMITIMKKSQEATYSGSLTKNEIIEHGRHLCDKSFTKPEPESYYTAWSSMKTLISKGLVLRQGSPPKFSLTDEGEIIALNLIENDDSTTPEDDLNAFVARSNNLIKSTANENVNLEKNDPMVIDSDDRNQNRSSQSLFVTKTVIVNNIEENNFPASTVFQETNSQISKVCKTLTSSNNNTQETTSSQASSNTETIIFPPRSFDVILLVDTQETTGGTRKPSDDETISELQRLNANFEVRHLKIGDFTWICRERTTKQELVLPYIAERKRMDDLGHSIKDGRFHEQKFRLKQCGIQNLMYIVESYGNNTRTVLPLGSLIQGATNTLIQEQFQVKFTENHRHSMQYLSGITLMLKHIYQDKTIMSCSKESLTPSNISDNLISLLTFKEFNKGASKVKKFKVKDIFVRQLLQLKGMSVEKALAIVEKYPTPKLLRMEYDRLGSQGEKLLAAISYGPLKKAVGPVISRSVFQLYTVDKLF